jgi:hypothetical protein
MGNCFAKRGMGNQWEVLFPAIECHSPELGKLVQTKVRTPAEVVSIEVDRVKKAFGAFVGAFVPKEGGDKPRRA